MKAQSRRITSLLAALVAMLPLSVRAQDPITADQALDALERYICFNVFWRDTRQFPLGRRVSMTLHLSTERADLWSTDIVHPVGTSRWVTYVKIEKKGPVFAVSDMKGMNSSLASNSSQYKEEHQAVFGGPHMSLRVTLPSMCQPRFDSDNQGIKEQLLTAAISSMRDKILGLNKSGERHYPARLQVVIADFNIDYPEVRILVPSRNEVFVVPIPHLNEDDVSYAPAIENPSNPLRSKINAYGIPRELQLDP